MRMLSSPMSTLPKRWVMAMEVRAWVLRVLRAMERRVRSARGT
jgi:hypothetical protein